MMNRCNEKQRAGLHFATEETKLHAAYWISRNKQLRVPCSFSRQPGVFWKRIHSV